MKIGNKKAISNWNLPTESLLPRPKDSIADAGDIRGNADVIREVLAEFDIAAKVRETNVGPKVTSYVLKIKPPTPIQKVSALEVNIALSLKAQAIRVEVMSEKRRLVTIEVPNLRSAVLPISSMLSSAEWKKSVSQTSFIIGKDVYGKVITSDLGAGEHILFAGQTGSGKSVLNNAILASLLSRNTPETLKLILVDPKQVEFAPYKDVPHLQMPVITSPKGYAEALNWLSEESDRRTQLIAASGADSIDEFNGISEIILPRVVVVCDEISDLMMNDARHVETTVHAIANSPKDLGIHFILSTSRPSMDVVTESLRSSMSTRWALTMASQVDSMTILEVPGAEKLLGQGDMLLKSDTGETLQRIQIAHIGDDDVSSIVAFWKNQAAERNYSSKDIIGDYRQ